MCSCTQNRGGESMTKRQKWARERNWLIFRVKGMIEFFESRAILDVTRQTNDGIITIFARKELERVLLKLKNLKFK